ncbi:MAG: hypothetical protein Q7T16_01420 [Candidatus Burarchaeum sp.]|nr:hypothetical protein [Candidatus Burarchaeum sp.]MDO8339296.1 hypothetical protein [Candidatus Burarchaeum sp.]
MASATPTYEVAHSPTLNTILMVEKVLTKMDESVITVAQLKRCLPKQVNHNTLMVILDYLDRSNKIAFGSRGITWMYNPKMAKYMKLHGVDLKDL